LNKRIAFRFLVGIAAVAGLIALMRGRFRYWRLSQILRLRQNSKIARTSLGSIEYRLTGTGPTVLIVHGGPGGYDSDALYRYLIDAGFSVLSPSRPGYLRTRLRGRENFAAQAELLLALLDTLNVKQAAVFGFSAGGPVALQVALRGGERVAALVLESSITHRFEMTDPTEAVLIGSGYIPRRLQQIVFWLTHRFVEYLPASVLPIFFGGVVTNDLAAQNCAQVVAKDDQQMALFKAIFDNNVPLSIRQKGYDNDLHQLQTMPDAPIEAIQVPTLIVHSRLDKSVPLEHAEYAQAKIIGAALLTIDGCGHFIQFGETGKQVRTDVITFLKRTLNELDAR
jgi:pimeloyl-ACP methyl ester carboxylesterase